MRHYKCHSCAWIGEYFELDHKTWLEQRPYGDSGCYEELGADICPECGSEDIEEIDEDIDFGEEADW